MFTECILLKTYYGEINQNRMEITDNNICIYNTHIGQKDTHTCNLFIMWQLWMPIISVTKWKIVTTTYACLKKIVFLVG